MCQAAPTVAAAKAVERNRDSGLGLQGSAELALATLQHPKHRFDAPGRGETVDMPADRLVGAQVPAQAPSEAARAPGAAAVGVAAGRQYAVRPARQSRRERCREIDHQDIGARRRR